MKREMLAFLRTVPDDQVPGLLVQIRRGALWSTLASFLTVFFFFFAKIYADQLHVGRAILGYGTILSVTLVWFGVLWRKPPRNLEFFHSAFAIVLAFQASLQHWYLLSGSSPFAGRALFVIPLVALTCAMRPRWFLLVGSMITLNECLLSYLTRSDHSLGVLVGTMLTGVALTFFCTICAQFMRHHWHRQEKAHQQLLIADRLATLGRNTASIAHELKTPLAAAHHELYGVGELVLELKESLGHPDVTMDDLRQIVDELGQHEGLLKERMNRVTSFVTELREHTQQAHHHEQVSFHPSQRVEAALRLLQHKLKNIEVDLVLEEGGACLEGDPTKLDQVLVNLITNAFEAHPEPTSLCLRVETWSTPTHAMLAVQDNGPGVPEALRESIFQSLFTTKGDTGGTGLGLAVCRSIVEDMFKGELRLVPCDTGARFEVFLPLVPSQVDVASSSSSIPLAQPISLSSQTV